MKKNPFSALLCIIFLLLSSCNNSAPKTEEPNNIRAYLSTVAKEITDHVLSDIKSLPDWEKQQPQSYDEFIEMMGLQDMPLKAGRPDLNIQITGTIREEGFRIEKLYYESLPGLYVPANLYIPDHRNNSKGRGSG